MKHSTFSTGSKVSQLLDTLLPTPILTLPVCLHPKVLPVLLARADSSCEASAGFHQNSSYHPPYKRSVTHEPRFFYQLLFDFPQLEVALSHVIESIR